MKIRVLAVGSRMPSWVESGVAEYRKRLPRDFSLEITEIPMAMRGKNADLQRAIDKEGESLLGATGSNDYIVAMDVPGKMLSTEQMAQRVGTVRDQGQDLALLVGGPDGLAPAVLQAARERWSLSALTLPHPLVRIVLAEQIYRVWSVLNNHPYHRV